jgi:hypothetical protein
MRKRDGVLKFSAVSVEILLASGHFIWFGKNRLCPCAAGAEEEEEEEEGDGEGPVFYITLTIEEVLYCLA